MIKQAIIPLAGLGTRLLPLTSVFAKELLPINGKPGIEYILDECIDAGIKEIIFIVSEKKKMKILAPRIDFIVSLLKNRIFIQITTSVVELDMFKKTRYGTI